MNMISTGAFLNEMDASNKQHTLAEKFAAVWEKKNAKAARAGGVSLMALSLAACGGSSDTATVVTPDPDPAPVDPTPVTPSARALTTDLAENIRLESGQDASGVISSKATETTLNADDEITSVSGSGATFTLVDTSGADVTTTETGSVRNFDNLQYDLGSLSVSGTAQIEIALTDFSKVKKVTFDNTNDDSIINDIVLTGTGDDVTYNVGSDFSAFKVTPTAGTSSVDVTMAAAANTLIVVNTSGDVTADVTGTLNTTATTSSGLVRLTSTGNNTVTDATAAASVFATSSAGAVTVTDANSALLVNVNAAKGVTLTDVAAVTNLDVVAGGNVSVTNTGAGDMNIATTGTITTTGTINSTTGTFSSVGASSIKGNALATITVSGNGGAADYTMSAADHAALAKIIVEGSDDVTVAVVGQEIGGALAIDDNGTGTFKLDVEGTAGVVTLSGDVVDDLNIKSNMSTNDVTVVSGQNVDITTSQTGTSNLVVGTAANAASNTVTLDLDDGNTSNGTAVDITSLTVTQAATVGINAGLDVNANGDGSILTSVSASANNATLTVNLGANNATLDDAITAGAAGAYGTVKVTGSGNLTILGDGSNQFTANALTLNASEMTGRVLVTSTEEVIGAVTTINTGSGADALYLGVNTIANVSTGAGNDTVELDNADYGTTTVNFNGGTGTDTLIFQDGAKLSDLNSGSTFTGFETLKFVAAGSTQEIDADLLNDATYNVVASASGATGSVVVKFTAADTDIDMSSLVGSTALATTIAGMTFVSDASALTSAAAITGVAAAKNTITGTSAAGDTLTGGGKADTFKIDQDSTLFNSSNVMLDTIVGGVGTDVLQIGTTGTAFTVVAADSWAKASTVETISAVANTKAYSLTLGATAETAGIVTVDLSSAGASGANTVNTSAYASAGVTVTGSAAADTITTTGFADSVTGGTGADTISTGAGNDTLNYALTADLFATNAKVDTSVDGGAGTDTIKVGTSGTAFAIAATDVWTGISNVETITANANTAAVTIDLDETAEVAGIRTVDISAAAKATGNIVDASEFTGVYAAAVTITGSATGANALTGGELADTIVGGTAADTIIGGAGADTINVGSDSTTDYVELDNEATVDTITNFKAGTGGDVLQLDFSELNGGAIAASDGSTVSSSSTEGFISYTVGVATASNSANENIIYVTNTTGINSITDVNTALGNDNITMDGGSTGFANTEASIIVFYDADDGKAVVGHIEDSAAATAGVFDGTGTTFVELANLTMSASDYGDLVATNFAFIA